MKLVSHIRSLLFNTVEIPANATTKSFGPSFRGGRLGRNKGSFQGGSHGRDCGRNGVGSSYFPDDQPLCQVCFKPSYTAL